MLRVSPMALSATKVTGIMLHLMTWKPLHIFAMALTG
jgi:hypothetical protein